MFFTSVGLFTARGDYPAIILKLGEISFVLWLPFLIMGIFLTLVGIGIYFAKTPK